jgi:dihydrofolate reductase
MIVAMNHARVIGRDGDLPWRLASDMARFKELTLGNGDESNAVIMGRATFDSLPDNFRPLPDRINIVMSRDVNWRPSGGEDAEVALYPGRAIEIAFAYGCEECWIIGGGQIYDMFLENVDEIHMTLVDDVSDSKRGDVLFPELDENVWSKEKLGCVEASDNDEFGSTHFIFKKV